MDKMGLNRTAFNFGVQYCGYPKQGGLGISSFDDMHCDEILPFSHKIFVQISYQIPDDRSEYSSF